MTLTEIKAALAEMEGKLDEFGTKTATELTEIFTQIEKVIIPKATAHLTSLFKKKEEPKS